MLCSHASLTVPLTYNREGGVCLGAIHGFSIQSLPDDPAPPFQASMGRPDWQLAVLAVAGLPEPALVRACVGLCLFGESRHYVGCWGWNQVGVASDRGRQRNINKCPTDQCPLPCAQGLVTMSGGGGSAPTWQMSIPTLVPLLTLSSEFLRPSKVSGSAWGAQGQKPQIPLAGVLFLGHS